MASVKAGQDKGVAIQVSFRNDHDSYSPHGPGTLPASEDQVDHYKYLVQKIVNRYKSYTAFIIDTFNEPEKWSAKQGDSSGWIELQSALIKGIRETEFEGFIVVEDGDDGGGYADGYYSAISEYADQIREANGGPNHIIGSFHSYTGDSSKIKNEVEHILDAGFTPQIGEYGNAEWTGSSFNFHKGAITAADTVLSLLGDHGSALAWYEAFPNDQEGGSIKRKYGYSKSEQLQ